MLFKIVSTGFSNWGVEKKDIVSPAYLDNSGNVMDFIIILSFWIYFLLSISGNPNFLFFRGLSSLRPIRLLFLTPGLSVSRKFNYAHFL